MNDVKDEPRFVQVEPLMIGCIELAAVSDRRKDEIFIGNEGQSLGIDEALALYYWLRAALGGATLTRKQIQLMADEVVRTDGLLLALELQRGNNYDGHNLSALLEVMAGKVIASLAAAPGAKGETT